MSALINLKRRPLGRDELGEKMPYPLTVSRFLSLFGAVGLTVLTACTSPNITEVDLVSIARFGEIPRERNVVPIDEESSREFSSGWSWPEKDARGNRYRWAIGETSNLSFFCVEPRFLKLEISVRAFVWDGSPEQGLRCRLNGTDLGKRIFRSADTLEFDLPAESIRPGENSIEFLWDRATRVSEVRLSRDQRRLAAAVSAIAINGLTEEHQEWSGIDPQDGIFVPAGSAVRIALMAGGESELSVQGPEGNGDHLQIWVRQEGRPFSQLCGPCEDQATFELGHQAGPLQISFRATGQGPATLTNATVRWPMSLQSKELENKRKVAKPDVILYVVDTLRADRLEGYGGPKGVSPAFLELAADGVLFERAVAQSSWTKPSTISLLSGLLTTEHGVRSREPVIPQEVELIAERFKAAGYRTGAFTTNAYLIPSAGFDRGFDTFEFAQLTASEVTRRAVEWLDSGDDERPVFLWIHTVDPHAPYQPGPAFRQRFAPGIGSEIGTVEHVRSLGGQPQAVTAPFVPLYLSLYDAEISQNDEALRELVEFLKAGGRYEDACVAFVSDHGEEFWEHGVNGHGWDLFDEVLRVPLVVKPPLWSNGGQRIARTVQQIDLAPTLLRLAGLEPSSAMSGGDLFDFDEDDHRLIFSEMTYEGREGLAVQAGKFKYIEPLSRGFLPDKTLFNLADDPFETNNIIDRFPITAAWLAQEGRERMSRLENAPQSVAEAFLNSEERHGLEALGYLDPMENE